MISKALRNVVSLTIPLLIAATAIAQTPKTPLDVFTIRVSTTRLGSSFLFMAVSNGIKEPRGSVMCGDGTVPSGS
jgi:hypothetical protein